MIYKGREATVVEYGGNSGKFFVACEEESIYLSNSGEWVRCLPLDDGWWYSRLEVEEFLAKGLVPVTPEYDEFDQEE